MRFAQKVDVRLERRPEGTVATVIVCNADRLNTLNSALADEFVDKTTRLASHDDLRVVVLTGEGDKAFIGGADIQEMGRISDRSEAHRFISRMQACNAAIRAIPVPTIARIQGYAFGAGLEMAAACDIRIASQHAVFGMPEVKLGIPSVAEAALLPMLIGWGRTRRMLLLGERFNAAEMREFGFLERVTYPSDIDKVTGSFVDRVLGCGATAVRLQKALIHSWENLPLREAIATGLDVFADAYETNEPAVMMGAFMKAQLGRKAGSLS
jgi:enoyl-CoA hydratase